MCDDSYHTEDKLYFITVYSKTYCIFISLLSQLQYFYLLSQVQEETISRSPSIIISPKFFPTNLISSQKFQIYDIYYCSNQITSQNLRKFNSFRALFITTVLVLAPLYCFLIHLQYKPLYFEQYFPIWKH